MSKTGQNSDQSLEEIKRKVKRQRSMIALLSGTIFVFMVMYML